MKKILFFIFILMSCVSAINAQFSQFHAGLVFPSGKFADGDEKKDALPDGKGFAATGFTIGFKSYHPLSTEGLSWVIGIEAFYNGLNSDFRDATEDNGWKDITFPKYLNFPATIGLNYAIPINEKVKIYGEAAIGVNFSFPTNWKLEDRSGYQDMEYKITSAFGFAYGLEGGLFIDNKYSIGLRYNNLGSYKYKYEVEYETADSHKDKYDKALPITNISLSVGLLF